MQHTNQEKAKVIIKCIAEVIKEQRENLSKSQRILAYEYDIQKSLISRLENGKNEPKIVSLFMISEALGLDISDFFKLVCEKLPDDFSILD